MNRIYVQRYLSSSGRYRCGPLKVRRKFGIELVEVWGAGTPCGVINGYRGVRICRRIYLKGQSYVLVYLVPLPTFQINAKCCSGN